ncbi:MAG: pantetheine-phosphate adenylyltransferase, partial [Bacteroidaceae bacterium]|nr:pantetheine-phosphate adenylyltransferase [Bacteroidaceae bacterium]
GHADLVERALRLFDHVVIGVGCNEQKQGWLPVQERIESLQSYYALDPRVSVASYACLTVDFARSCGATAILRGVRSIKDYEYELSLADVNSRLVPQLETVVLYARPELAACSSSVVRELAHFGHSIAAWLPEGLSYPSLSKKTD